MRPHAALAVAITALTTLALAPAVPAQAATPAGTYAHDAFVATNHQRVRHDRVKLTRSDCLQGFARMQARRMAHKQEIYHQDLQKILDTCHLNLVGENVASGFTSGRSVVDDGWMKSKDHRANILQRRYRGMAIAARKGDDGRWYVSQVFGRHS